MGVQMRHDAHYVEELAGRRPTPVGRFIALDKLDPNPEQPRVEIGDLTDLTASIIEKGVLEPLLVKPSSIIPGRWMIIAGERRWRAARDAGLREVPCIELEVDDRAVAEIALIENMQRKDLTPWEEADGLRALCDKFGYTHEEIARKVGKSRSSITEALSISTLPESVRERCRRADINSKSILLQIVRQPDNDSMWDLVEQIVSKGMTRDDARQARRKQLGIVQDQSRQPYVYKYSAPGKEFKLELKFRKSNVDSAEVIEALKMAVAAIEKGA
jgi:ParB family transcriptional regulator, chromosome partitioning protein